MTDSPPAYVTYASVVLRESVRIAVTLAALNNLEVKTTDIENAYLGELSTVNCGPNSVAIPRK
jgi:hypothetical protein